MKQRLEKQITEIINKIKPFGSLQNIEGMQKYGIRFKKAFGVNIPVLRKLAKDYKYNHELALELWKTGIHEAMLLAIFIDDPKQITKKQMNEWVKDFASWDICDQCCGNLFDKTPYAYDTAFKWSKTKYEFIKRAGFVLITQLAVHDKEMEDDKFLAFFPLIESEADDERNFVRKAVNWALRQIGKRNSFLWKEAVELAERIKNQESKSAKWIAADALRELRSERLILRNR